MIHQWGQSQFEADVVTSTSPGGVPAVGAADTVLCSNGTTSEWDSSVDVTSLTASSFTAVGSTVAAQGQFRCGTSGGVWALNGSTDVRLAGMDGSGNAYYGTNATVMNLHGNSVVALTQFTMQAAYLMNGVITPTALSGDVNNYNPTGLSTCNAIRQDGGAANRNITGLAANNWRFILLTNIGTTNNLVLVHASGSSSAANQFDLANAANLTLLPRQSVILWYDASSTKWRALT